MFIRRLRYWIQSAKRRTELREEMEAHLEERMTQLRESGLGEAEAGAEARRLFGNFENKREESQDIWIKQWWSEFWGDIRHGGRLLRGSPGFSVCIVASMAVGVAAATTIFSIVDPLLFRSLPFQDDSRLVSVGVMGPIDRNEFAIGNMFLEWRDHQNVFSSLTAMSPGTQCDLQLSQTERVSCVAVQSNLLTTLGVVPSLGRNFSADEDQPKAPLVALISHRLWRSAFGGRPDVVGQPVKVDDRLAQVVGVLPVDFVLPQGADADVLLPAQLDESIARGPQATVFLRAFARLKPGISTAGAQQQMGALFRQTIERYVPRELRKEARPVIRSVRDRSIQDAKLGSWLLLGAVVLLVLLACLTVGNLLLAQAISRREEFSMRMALGASRTRLLRQALTEAMLAGGIGGIAGSLLSVLLLRALVLWAPGGFLHLEQARVDGRVLLFSLLLSVATATLAGLVPALRKPKPAPVRNSQQTSGLPRMREAFVVAQLSCSLVLLTAALLFSRSLHKLETQRTGFSEERLFAASVTVSHARYAQPDRLRAFYAALEASLQRIPGVSAVALSDSAPPAGGMHGRPLANMQIAGRTALAGNGGMVSFRYISPSYFRTLGIPMLRGRGFSDAEVEQESSLVISDSLARRLFRGESPVGQRMTADGGATWLTVIGVAADVKNSGMDVPAWPEYYRLRTRRSDQLGYSAVALLRTNLDESILSQRVRREISQLDPALPVRVESVAQRVHQLTDRPRFLALILATFAVTSVLLAGTGLFGVVAFLVTMRTHEFGVRSAIGATTFDIVLMVQKQTAWWTLTGISLGLLASLPLGHFVRGLLFGVAPYDPMALAGAAFAFLCIAVIAAWGPSRRAGRIDPAIALRGQ